jgi:enamine deaminase RidA (YjgF/YER057c/UK114 family)
MVIRHEPTPIMHSVVEQNGVLYLGGTAATDKSLDIKGQTEQIPEQIGRILEQRGSSKDKILSATIFLTSLAGKQAVRSLGGLFRQGKPARARDSRCRGAGRRTLIEIVAVAAR